MRTGCKATNKNGEPCSAQAWRDGWCRWHHPQLEAQRQEERRKGGRAKSNAARARKQLPAGNLTPDDLRGILGATIAKVLRGDVEPGVGNCVATLARAYVAVIETGEFEERLAALEVQTGLGRRSS